MKRRHTWNYALMKAIATSLFWWIEPCTTIPHELLMFEQKWKWRFRSVLWRFIQRELSATPGEKARLKEVDASLLQHHPIIKSAKLWPCKEKKRVDFYSAATGKLNTHYHNYLSSYVVQKKQTAKKNKKSTKQNKIKMQRKPNGKVVNSES